MPGCFQAVYFLRIIDFLTWTISLCELTPDIIKMAVFGNPATNQTEQLYGDVKLGSVVTPYSANYWLVWHSAKLA